MAPIHGSRGVLRHHAQLQAHRHQSVTGVNHGGRTQRPTEPRARATAGTPESSRTTVRPEGGADLLNCEEPRNWRHVLAPVRPTLKVRYPLTPIDRFGSWTREDGAPLGPWLRTHWRLGAAVVASAPRSQTMTGTVEQCQRCTGMPFPDSGDYVIPDGLSTLRIDRDGDPGVYVKPNVWMQHQSGQGATGG